MAGVDNTPKLCNPLERKKSPVDFFILDILAAYRNSRVERTPFTCYGLKEGLKICIFGQVRTSAYFTSPV